MSIESVGCKLKWQKEKDFQHCCHQLSEGCMSDSSLFLQLSQLSMENLPGDVSIIPKAFFLKARATFLHSSVKLRDCDCARRRLICTLQRRLGIWSHKVWLSLKPWQSAESRTHLYKVHCRNKLRTASGLSGERSHCILLTEKKTHNNPSHSLPPSALSFVHCRWQLAQHGVYLLARVSAWARFGFGLSRPHKDLDCCSNRPQDTLAPQVRRDMPNSCHLILLLNSVFYRRY